jgi:DNA-directed RNA polymerase subunit RPC12/RpoP
MTVTGKTFVWGNCAKKITLTSEGAFFICPNCNTKIIQVVQAQAPALININMILLVRVISLVLFGLIIFFYA